MAGFRFLNADEQIQIVELAQPQVAIGQSGQHRPLVGNGQEALFVAVEEVAEMPAVFVPAGGGGRWGSKGRSAP